MDRFGFILMNGRRVSGEKKLNFRICTNIPDPDNMGRFLNYCGFLIWNDGKCHKATEIVSTEKEGLVVRLRVHNEKVAYESRLVLLPWQMVTAFEVFEEEGINRPKYLDY